MQANIKLVKTPADMRSMQERRSEVRMLCADMVQLYWNDDRGKKRKVTGLLEDISASGACLQLEAPVPAGVVIHWDCPKQQFSGQVRYCVYREIGYFVGVEFDPAVRWSKRTYRPQHLLDLQSLLAKAGK